MTQKTVLVVEDDLELRDVIEDILALEGYDVIPAANGKQALDYLSLEADVPSIILLDLMTPIVTGWQVIQAVRSGKNPRVPIVVLSGAARDKPPGATAYLRKPVNLSDLIRTVHQHAA